MHRDRGGELFCSGFFFFFFFFFFLRFRDFQQVSVRLAHHILAHSPRAHGQFFSDVGLSSAMLRIHAVDIGDPQKDVRSQLPFLDRARQVGVVRYVEQCVAGADPGVDRGVSPS